MTKFLALSILVFLQLNSHVANGQTAEALTTVQPETASEWEEIAMCHHAIKAAHYEAIWLRQNPYFRYIINSPADGHGANIFPIPERCKTFQTRLITEVATMTDQEKTSTEKSLLESIGLKVSDIARDAQFLSTVIEYKDLRDWRKLDGPDAIK